MQAEVGSRRGSLGDLDLDHCSESDCSIGLAYADWFLGWPRLLGWASVCGLGCWVSFGGLSGSDGPKGLDCDWVGF